jgi:acyl-CoA thioester hydrolase
MRVNPDSLVPPVPSHRGVRHDDRADRARKAGTVDDAQLDVDGFTWSGEIRLRWRDLDAMGHVHHADYLVLLDEARMAMFAAAVRPEPEFVIARLELDYRGEVLLDDGPLTAYVQVAGVGRSSVTLRERLATRSGRVAVESRCVVVLWDPVRRVSRKVTDEERQALGAAPPAADG